MSASIFKNSQLTTVSGFSTTYSMLSGTLAVVYEACRTDDSTVASFIMEELEFAHQLAYHAAVDVTAFRKCLDALAKSVIDVAQNNGTSEDIAKTLSRWHTKYYTPHADHVEHCLELSLENIKLSVFKGRLSLDCLKSIQDFGPL
jgi:hypothetical protein